MVAHTRSLRVLGIAGALALLGGFAVATPATANPATSASTSAASANPMPVTVPELTSWTGATGTFTLGSSPRIVVDPSAVSANLGGRTAQQEAARLAEDLLGLGVNARVVVGSPAANDIVLRADSSLAPEAYALTITDRVTISSSSASGLFYGGRTLLQLRTASAQLPLGETIDTPGQRLRGGMIDAGRKYWSISYLKDLIRRMSYLKLNLLNLHLAESEAFRLDSPKFPGLAPTKGAYNEQEIRDLVAFAAQYHVDIMPGFEFPGHATVVSNYFKNGFGMGANPCTAADMHSHLTPDWVMDMTTPKALEDTQKLLDEFLPWFSSDYVHVGGDELPGALANCGRVKSYVASDPTVGSAGDMLLKYLNGVNDVVRKHGKKTIIYNGFEHMSRTQQVLDKSVIIQDWEGDGTNPLFAGHQKLWMNSSYVYLTPNNYHNLFPKPEWLMQSWAPNTNDDMLGSSFGVWADYNFWADDQYYEEQPTMKPLRAALADRSWNVTARGTAATLATRLATVGESPGVVGFADPARVGAKAPLHRYEFEPASYPDNMTWAGSPGNTIAIPDATGRLNGSTYIIYNPAYTDAGVQGKALNFTADRQGVGLGGTDLRGPWTMSVWVKLSAVTSDATLLDSNQGRRVLLSDGTSGNVSLVSPTGRRTFANGSLPTGAWTQVTLVDDGTKTVMYRNGEKQGEVSGSMPLPLKAIGAWNTSFRGAIDNLTIWDAALPAAQIAANYATEAPPAPHTGPINFWSMNESDGVMVDTLGGDDATLVEGSRTPGRNGGGVSLTGGSTGLQVNASPVSGPWTASMWVKRKAATKSSALLSGTSGTVKLEQWPDTGKIGFTKPGVGDYTIDYSAPIGEWVYLTFVSDGNALRAYANGEAVGQVANTGDLGRSWIGRLPSGNSLDAVNADLDDVLIADRAFSPAEVRDLFAGYAQGSGEAVAAAAVLTFDGLAPEKARVGDRLTLRLVIANTGIVDVSGVGARVDRVDDSSGASRAASAAPPADEAFACAGTGQLNAGKDLTCTVEYVVSAADVQAGRVALSATVTGTGMNPLRTPLSVNSNTVVGATEITPTPTGPTTTSPAPTTSSPTVTPITNDPGQPTAGGGLATTGTASSGVPIVVLAGALLLLGSVVLVTRRRSRQS